MEQAHAGWAVDELGPALVAFLRPCAGVEAVVAVDNVALGPAIGGVRMRADVTPGEVARLARAMTVKNALAGLPHGGGKAGIAAPGLPPADHERVMRAFARAIRPLTDYIPGPDMGTSETSMAYVHDEIGRAVGLPSVLGGVPLDELGAGANIPVTIEAEALLAERGVLCVPDVVANAGGVICAAAEYRGAGRAEAFAEITEKIGDSTAELLDRLRRAPMTPRAAAGQIASERLRRALALRRRF